MTSVVTAADTVVDTVAVAEAVAESGGLFHSKYKLGVCLGKGSFGSVYRAKHVDTDSSYAVKHMSYKGEVSVKSVHNEFKIMQSLKHPNIVQCYHLYIEDDNFYILMELLEGGELFDRIIKRSSYTEVDARHAALAMVLGIKYCHDRNIIHRDLKPENMMLKSNDNDVDLKITDFGLAKILPESTACTTPNSRTNAPVSSYGTLMYGSPELLNKHPYNKATDVWSIGVILYVLLSGCFPFDGPFDATIEYRISNAIYSFESQEWNNISDEAKDLLRCILVIDTAARYTIDQVLNHTWFHHTSTVGTSNNIVDNIDLLRRYQLRTRFRRAGNLVRAANKFQQNGSRRRSTIDSEMMMSDSSSSGSSRASEFKRSSDDSSVLKVNAPSVVTTRQLSRQLS